jgi:hypothetical protein
MIPVDPTGDFDLEPRSDLSRHSSAESSTCSPTRRLHLAFRRAGLKSPGASSGGGIGSSVAATTAIEDAAVRLSRGLQMQRQHQQALRPATAAPGQMPSSMVVSPSETPPRAYDRYSIDGIVAASTLAGYYQSSIPCGSPEVARALAAAIDGHASARASASGTPAGGAVDVQDSTSGTSNAATAGVRRASAVGGFGRAGTISMHIVVLIRFLPSFNLKDVVLPVPDVPRLLPVPVVCHVPVYRCLQVTVGSTEGAQL